MKYDVTTGAVRGSEKHAVEDDVDASVTAAMKKLPASLDHARKLNAWPSVYKLDLVTWSEGDSVLARRGSEILLCKKRGGACGSALLTVTEGADVAGGASKDGGILGAVVGSRFVAVDAKTGAKKVDVSFALP